MNIFFDYQAFALQSYGGISRYFCELITGINNTKEHQAHLSLLWSNNVHLPEYSINIKPYPFPKKLRLLHKSNKLFNHIDCKLNKYDIYHATYFDDFLSFSTGSKPFVTTFYDMTYEKLSHQFTQLSDDKWIIPQKRKIAEMASHLIAISESTKRDMIELGGIDPKKITVIHLGSPFVQTDAQIEDNILTIDCPYLLYVGNRFDYKNFILFLQAIAPVLTKYKINLICAGGGNFSRSEENIIRQLSLSGLVKYKAINDIILRELYKKAIAFAFPSLYEGFGIPILEAFACNCPCVISNTSSLPEVAGEAALYMNPTDPESMRFAVESIILDGDLRKKLIERGRQQLSKFSWHRTVSETLSLYRKLI